MSHRLYNCYKITVHYLSIFIFNTHNNCVKYIPSKLNILLNSLQSHNNHLFHFYIFTSILLNHRLRKSLFALTLFLNYNIEISFGLLVLLYLFRTNKTLSFTVVFIAFFSFQILCFFFWESSSILIN